MLRKILLLLIIVTSILNAETAQEILDKVDYNFSPKSITYDGEMIIHKKNKKYVKKMKAWGIGTEESFVEFISPARDKGTRYLRKDDNLWMYLPKADRTVKISGHMLRQSMMGSDISYEDQTDRAKLNELYDSKIIKETDKIYTLELILKPGEEATYYRRVAEIDKKRYTVLKSLLYSKSGKLLKELVVTEIEQIGDKFYPVKMVFTDKIKNKSYTEIISKNIVLDQEIPSKIFTLKNLERKR